MKIQFTSEELLLVKRLRREMSEKVKYVKLTVLLMLYNERSLSFISADLGIDISTIRRYYYRYKVLGDFAK